VISHLFSGRTIETVPPEVLEARVQSVEQRLVGLEQRVEKLVRDEESLREGISEY